MFIRSCFSRETLVAPQFMHSLAPQRLCTPAISSPYSEERKLVGTLQPSGVLPVPRNNLGRKHILSNQESRRATLELKRHLEHTAVNLIVIGSVVD